MSHSFKEEWRCLLDDMSQHTDIFGNDLFPITNKRQWVFYNEILKRIHVYENETTNIKNVCLIKEEIAELENFWKFTQKKCKNDNTILALWKEDSGSSYTVRAFLKDKIKDIENIKGDVQK